MRFVGKLRRKQERIEVGIGVTGIDVRVAVWATHLVVRLFLKFPT